MSDGNTLITYDNCVIPALEAFVEEFPDFSPFGHKGLLAITGFDGILGYRTQRDSPNRQSEIEAVRPVVQALLDAGWYFASHSYAHRDMAKNDLDRLKDDTQKWQDEVASLVGDTSIYIFPFGSRTTWDDPRYLYLIEAGFPMLMGVGFPPRDDPPFFRLRERYFFMDRWNIDGISLRREPNRLTPLLDADYVYSQEERNGVPRTTPALAGVVDDNGEIVYYERFAITVALGGDVQLDGGMGRRLRRDGPGAILSPGLADVFRSADIAMINLESAISDIGEPWPDKLWTFRANPFILDFLRDDLNIEVVSLANNHTVDYGFDAFVDTVRRLDAHGIGRVGGGLNLAEAMAPHVVEQNGITVAFIGAAIIANRVWAAGADSPGLLLTRERWYPLVYEAVETARELYDYVIVYMHWGTERVTEPTAVQIRTARRLIDAGADAVIGAHPHVIQSFEIYNGRPIAYSIGNFLMYNHYDNTAVVRLRLLGGRAEMEVIPCRVTNGVYNEIAGDRQARELREFWNSININATIGEDWVLR
jgi:poly-gamma-glutamate synthesis protein (capsule biosynthesis protein)